MQSSRTFVAIEVEPPALGEVCRLVARLQNVTHGVRWTTPEHLHVTVKFLGDIDNRELPTVCNILQDACSQAEPFGLQLGGLGTFPKGKPPRIVWLGINDEDLALQTLHTRLDAALAELGVPREARVFFPHLTLGRVTRGADTSQLNAILQTAVEHLDTRFDVDQVQLLASVKERSGIRYEPINRVPL